MSWPCHPTPLAIGLRMSLRMLARTIGDTHGRA
jgi:hypothetical protein